MTVEEMEKRQAEIAEEAKTATGDALAQLFDEAQKLNEGRDGAGVPRYFRNG